MDTGLLGSHSRPAVGDTECVCVGEGYCILLSGDRAGASRSGVTPGVSLKRTEILGSPKAEFLLGAQHPVLASAATPLRAGACAVLAWSWDRGWQGDPHQAGPEPGIWDSREGLCWAGPERAEDRGWQGGPHQAGPETGIRDSREGPAGQHLPHSADMSSQQGFWVQSFCITFHGCWAAPR